jgi:hypothetical protein
MGAFFESALLFSLAVLIVLVGLLIYYFKGRIVDIEQKNMKCLDIINDVYKSHLEFKQMVQNEFQDLIVNKNIVLMSDTLSHGGSDHQQALHGNIQSDNRIMVEITENSTEDSDSESESDSDSDSDSEFELHLEPDSHKTKLINVNLSIPENYELDVDEVDELDIDELDADADADIVDMDDHTNILVNKLENSNEINEIKDSEGITLLVEKDSYKKMNLPALRSFIISKGYQTDSAKLQKMKKGELIDLIVSSRQSDNE